MQDLIAKLEEAECGSREWDAEVAQALGNEVVLGPFNPANYMRTPDGATTDLPMYTQSLDTAMTLVPEGWHTSLHGDPGDWLAELRDLDDQHPYCRRAYSWRREDWRTHGSPTAALAVCIAALRAREAQS